MMQDPELGGFVRVLIPVKLLGGYKVTFGVWLSVHPDDLRKAWEIWLTPAYKQLRLSGKLANALPPWGKNSFVKPLTAFVIDTESVPVAKESPDKLMRQIIQDEWPHDFVLQALESGKRD